MSIKKIAKVAGVSTATVSRVLNGSDKVREKTAKRVLKVVVCYPIKKLNEPGGKSVK